MLLTVLRISKAKDWQKHLYYFTDHDAHEIKIAIRQCWWQWATQHSYLWTRL